MSASWCFEVTAGSVLGDLFLPSPLPRVGLEGEGGKQDCPAVAPAVAAAEAGEAEEEEEVTPLFVFVFVFRCCLAFFSSCSCAILDLSKTSFESTTGVEVLRT